MTRMTGPDCVVRCNLINTHTHTHIDVVHDNGGGEGDRDDSTCLNYVQWGQRSG